MLEAKAFFLSPAELGGSHFVKAYKRKHGQQVNDLLSVLCCTVIFSVAVLRGPLSDFRRHGNSHFCDPHVLLQL